METRRLGLLLMAGGAAMIVLALIWFAATFADAMDMAGEFGGAEHAAGMMSCLYSSGPICQGVAMFSDGPAYSPVVFWIGVIAMLGGVVVRFAAGSRTGAGGAAPGGRAAAPPSDEILGFIPPGQYARYSYILALCGAVAGLLLTPLAIVAMAGFVLALLGLTVYRPRLKALDVHHLGLLSLVFIGAALLLLITRGTFLFLLAALAQIACFYVGFNSYRHGRIVTSQNVRDEFATALTRSTPPASGPEQH